jgi:hypothetical protein
VRRSPPRIEDRNEMNSSMARAALVLTLAVLASRAASAGGVTSYFESSANQKPRGNAGVSVTSDRVRLNADLALRAPNRATEIMPRVSSRFALSDRVGLETRLDLSDWNSSTVVPGAKVDTRLHFQSSAPFLDELEGRVWRSPDGQSGRILKFGFYQKLSDTSAPTPLTIRSKAVVETTFGAAAPFQAGVEAGSRSENRRVGIETELGGLMSQRKSGRGALKIKLDRVAGSRPETAGSVAYDQSWRVGLGQVGMNLKRLRATYTTAGALQPSVGFTWHWSL